jgi:hypothetical protein
MRQRCTLPTHSSWKNYGGRGITVCVRWESFDAFLADMGERPGVEYSIERRNSNGNYTPRNCEWVLKAEQSRNRRNGRSYTYRSRTLSLKDWSKQTGVEYRVLLARHRNGWPAARALTEPVGMAQTAIEYLGRTMTATEWAGELGMNVRSFKSRISKGWPMEQIASTPIARTGRHR